MGAKKSKMRKKTGEVRGVTGDQGKKHLCSSYSGPMACILGTMLRTLEPKRRMWPSSRPEMNLPEVFLWPQTNSSLLPSLHSFYPFVKWGMLRGRMLLFYTFPWLSRQSDEG